VFKLIILISTSNSETTLKQVLHSASSHLRQRDAVQNLMTEPCSLLTHH